MCGLLSLSPGVAILVILFLAIFVIPDLAWPELGCYLPAMAKIVMMGFSSHINGHVSYPELQPTS